MARVKYYDQASQEWKYADAAFNMKGKDGYTPQKGIDYFTEEDVEGITGQILNQGVLTYNQQELTDEQKAQARENIGIDQIKFDKLDEDLDANGYRIVGLSKPQQSSEPATKGYVDTFAIEVNTFFMEHIGNKQNPHMVTAEQIGARPNTWMPTASDVGAATPQNVTAAKTEAVTIAQTYTNQQVQKASPQNLLDNSDFTNPVNQRGQTSYAEAKQRYTIDRWRAPSALQMNILKSSGVRLICTSTTQANGIAQFWGKPIEVGTTVTFALMETDGTLSIGTTKVPESSSIRAFTTPNGIYGQVHSNRVAIMVPVGKSIDVRWVALYEGEYTVDTLPQYRPKGYANELRECMRYYQRFEASRLGIAEIMGMSADITLMMPVQMQDWPTCVISGDGGIECTSVKSGEFTSCSDVFAYRIDESRMVLSFALAESLLVEDGYPELGIVSIREDTVLELSADLS